MADVERQTTPEGTTSTKANSRSSVVVLTSKSGEVFIIISPCCQTFTQVVSIDPVTGALHYEGIPGIDLFPSQREAYRHVMLVTRDGIMSSVAVAAIIGYVVVGSAGYLCVVTKASPACILFGGHTVHTVTRSKWLRFPLSYVNADTSRQELKNMEALQEYQLDGLHFYCETLDVTRPFPSPNPVSDPDNEYVWNDWMCKSFTEIGLRSACVYLCQGIAQGQFLPSMTSAPIEHTSAHVSMSQMSSADLPSAVNVCMISRKSNLNPGTRYAARGLNAAHGVGNEMECDLVVWRVTEALANEYNVKFAAHVWRRGTVPVWWHTELKSKIEKPVIVLGERPFEGADVYFTSLARRFNGPIACCNMLRCDPTKGETVLSDCYQACVRAVRKACNLDLSLINFDWHFNLKQLGPEHSLAGLFLVLAGPLKQMDLTTGEVTIPEPWSGADVCCRNDDVSIAETMFADSVLEDGQEEDDADPEDDIDDVINKAQAQQEQEAGRGSEPEPGPEADDDDLLYIRQTKHTLTATSPVDYSNVFINSTVVCTSAMRVASGNTAEIHLFSVQKGITRFNCADSLDRTNIATFFLSFSLLAECLRRVGSSLLARPRAPDALWPLMISPTLQEHESCLGSCILDGLARLFLANGDMCSMLYIIYSLQIAKYVYNCGSGEEKR